MKNIIVKCFSATFGILGLVLVGLFSHWMVSLGMFFMLWAHNIEKHI